MEQNNDSKKLDLKTIADLPLKNGITYKIAYDINKKIEGESINPIVLRRDADDKPFKIVMDRGEYDAVMTNFKQSHQKRKVDLTIGAVLRTEDDKIYKLAYETHAVKNDAKINNSPIILFQENEEAPYQRVVNEKEYATVLELFKNAHKEQNKDKKED